MLDVFNQLLQYMYIKHFHTLIFHIRATTGPTRNWEQVKVKSGPALGMGRGGLSPPKRLSCPPNQNVGKDSVTHYYDLCID